MDAEIKISDYKIGLDLNGRPVENVKNIDGWTEQGKIVLRIDVEVDEAYLNIGGFRSKIEPSLLKNFKK